MRSLFAALPLILAAACSGGDGTGNATSAAPVAAVAPQPGKPWTETVAKTPEGGTRIGNPDAPIKLVEYGSRLCPACGNFGRTGMQPLENTYVASGKVSYEFRDFLVHGVADLPATLLGQCADPSAFFPILEQTFHAQDGFNQKLQSMTPEQRQQIEGAKPVVVVNTLADRMGLVEFIKQRGVPEAKARQCLSDMTRIDALTKQTQDAGAAGTVSSTPTFILNGKPLTGMATWPEIEQALKAAGA